MGRHGHTPQASLMQVELDQAWMKVSVCLRHVIAALCGDCRFCKKSQVQWGAPSIPQSQSGEDCVFEASRGFMTSSWPGIPGSKENTKTGRKRKGKRVEESGGGRGRGKGMNERKELENEESAGGEGSSPYYRS